jgi:hypothetical protein
MDRQKKWRWHPSSSRYVLLLLLHGHVGGDCLSAHHSQIHSQISISPVRYTNKTHRLAEKVDKRNPNCHRSVCVVLCLSCTHRDRLSLPLLESLVPHLGSHLAAPSGPAPPAACALCLRPPHGTEVGLGGQVLPDQLLPTGPLQMVELHHNSNMHHHHRCIGIYNNDTNDANSTLTPMLYRAARSWAELMLATPEASSCTCCCCCLPVWLSAAVEVASPALLPLVVVAWVVVEAWVEALPLPRPFLAPPD